MARRSVLHSLIAVALTSCLGGGGPEPLRPATPADAGVILFMGLELPEAGTVIGGYFAGATFEVRQTTYTMTETARDDWTSSERERGEAIMRLVGFRVRSVGPPTSDARSLIGVQYGLSGRATDIAVRSTGASEPFTVDARVSVSWELLDLGSGRAVFGRRDEATARVSGSIEAAVGQALDNSLERLIADSSFLRVLAVPRLDPDAGRPRHVRQLPPGDRDPIALADSDLNASTDTSLVNRVAAGVVQITSQDGHHGTAFMLTRDGLGLAVARAVRDLRRLGVRFASGVERPARVLRSRSGLDVALIQVSCAGDCPTVDWEAPEGVDALTAVMVIGAPAEPGGAPAAVAGDIGGRWGIANGVTLQTAGPIDQGWPIARASSGKVFALVSGRPGRNPDALLLSEALRALRVVPPEPRVP